MDLVSIGKLLKPFGVRGHIKIDVKEAYEDDLERADVIFLRRPDGDIPYFVEKVSYDTPPTILLEDVDGPESASLLNMSEILLKSSDVTHSDDRGEDTLKKLVGFEIRDFGKPVGVIHSIFEYPQQTMAEIKVSGKFVLIPLVKEFIQEIDINNRFLMMELPEGLITSQF